MFLQANPAKTEAFLEAETTEASVFSLSNPRAFRATEILSEERRLGAELSTDVDYSDACAEKHKKDQRKGKAKKTFGKGGVLAPPSS
jgi:hypothetical protein